MKPHIHPPGEHPVHAPTRARAVTRLLRRARLGASVLPWRITGAKQALSVNGFAKAELVTMDVFDTALRRSVAVPADAFWLAIYRLNQRHGSALDIETTAQARIAAEAAARQAARQLGRFEVTLAEIYQQPVCDPAWRDALMAEEIATECDICFANPDILSLYNDLQARGIPVAFMSDTYLDQTVIEKLLANAGYTGAHSVFVSSAFGLSKIDGNLFAAVAQASAVAPGRIWHIGDNPVADVRNAHRAGWNALWYKQHLPDPGRHVRGATGQARIVASLLGGLPASLRAATPGGGTGAIWRAIGHDIAAPIYLGFAQFVAARVLAGKLDHVAFCARDGRIIREVYQRLQAVMPGLPPSSYIMVSRRALVFPMIRQLGESEMKFLTTQFASLRVEQFISRIGLAWHNHAASIGAAGLQPGTLIESEAQKAALRQLIITLAPFITQSAARERALLAEYLAQEGCLSCKSLALVDVGWQGSLQQAAGNLLSELGSSVALRGLYFGTYATIRNLTPQAGPSEAWFVDAGQPADRDHLARSQWAVLELLFTAQHGSVLGYRRAGQHIEAVLDETPDGDLPAYEQAAGQIQQAALAVVTRFLAAFGGVAPVAIDAASVAPRLERLVYAPSLAEARAIGDLFHFDGFGATRTGQYIAKPPNTFWSAGLRRAVRGFRAASWRRGYLVRAFGGTTPALAAIAAIEMLRPNFRSS